MFLFCSTLRQFNLVKSLLHVGITKDRTECVLVAWCNFSVALPSQINQPQIPLFPTPCSSTQLQNAPQRFSSINVETPTFSSDLRASWDRVRRAPPCFCGDGLSHAEKRATALTGRIRRRGGVPRACATVTASPRAPAPASASAPGAGLRLRVLVMRSMRTR